MSEIGPLDDSFFVDKLRKTFDIVREKKDYGNGRFVRKALEEAEMNLAGYDDLG